MASEIFECMFEAAARRDAELSDRCQNLWRYGVHDILQGSRMGLQMIETDAAFDRLMEDTALRSKCRVRKTCPECGSPFCSGAYSDEEGVIYTHQTPDAYAKALTIKYGY